MSTKTQTCATPRPLQCSRSIQTIHTSLTLDFSYSVPFCHCGMALNTPLQVQLAVSVDAGWGDVFVNSL
jgi:hypothetical protein